MSNPTTVANPPAQLARRSADEAPAGPDDLAVVFPTLTVINLVLGDWLATLPQCCGPSS